MSPSSGRLSAKEDPPMPVSWWFDEGTGSGATEVAAWRALEAEWISACPLVEGTGAGAVGATTWRPTAEAGRTTGWLDGGHYGWCRHLAINIGWCNHVVTTRRTYQLQRYTWQLPHHAHLIVRFGQPKIVRTEIAVIAYMFNQWFNVSIKKTQVDTTYVRQASFWPVCSFAYCLVYTVGRGRVAPTVIITGLSNGRNVYPI